MKSNEFKKLFGEIVKANGFERAFGGWFKESEECIIVLDLQKSNYGDYYQLMTKIYVQGVFGNKYSRSKELVKRNGGNIFRGEPPQYKDVFDFDTLIDDDRRKQRLEELFSEFMNPFIDKALSKSGIKELADKDQIFLLPAVKEELKFLSD
ncbi:MAG TPA: DUF4304 domain-containing protein [Mucilaginibacter sp.]|jgi:hypothetical protein|nr:DUF4304 domain-containing protein [Mucilaginibacter sp.]